MTHDTRDDVKMEILTKKVHEWLRNDGDSVSFDSLACANYIHHQLQKAREESIKALEIADGDIPPFPSAKDIESAKIGFITGVAWARTRLHSELDPLLTLNK